MKLLFGEKIDDKLFTFKKLLSTNPAARAILLSTQCLFNALHLSAGKGGFKVHTVIQQLRAHFGFRLVEVVFNGECFHKISSVMLLFAQ